jgi:hypothetical protein
MTKFNESENRMVHIKVGIFSILCAVFSLIVFTGQFILLEANNRGSGGGSVDAFGFVYSYNTTVIIIAFFAMVVSTCLAANSFRCAFSEVMGDQKMKGII